MAKNLNWFAARQIAKVEGKPIRRAAWHHWLTYRQDVFLWFTWRPADPTAEPPVAESRAVVRNDEFRDSEFLAADWTDEDWNVPPPVTGPDPGGNGSQPPSTNGGSGGTGDTGNGNDPSPGDGGGSWGGPGNPPGPGGAGDGSVGAGGGGVSGGGGSGDGTTGGNQTKCPVGSHWNGTHCVPDPPAANYTPTVTLNLVDDSDGPACYITVPPKGVATVTVAIPDPPNGTLKALPVSVSCFGQTRLATIGPGASQSFEFSGPIAPGNQVTATATASDGHGHTWTGTGVDSWEPMCLLFVGTWTGDQSINHNCDNDPPGSSSSDSGYSEVSHYSTTGQYAFNPAPGSGKSGQNTGLDLNFGDNGTTVHTTLPAGPTTNATFFVAAPGGITADIGANGQVTNVAPAKLGVFNVNGTTVEGACTTTTTSCETGPGGS